MLTPFPGTLDFAKWEKTQARRREAVDGIPMTRHWLIPQAKRPKVYIPHPTMSPTRSASARRACGIASTPPSSIWKRAKVREVAQGAAGVRADLEDVSADVRQHRHRHRQRPRQSSVRWARLIAIPCQKLFAGKPMPDLQLRPVDQDKAEAA